MVKDLLDVSRVRAGQSLPLDLEECDLGAVARAVFEELSATHGDRFALDAPGPVRGVWSQDELRRALWNLAENAVKYGHREGRVALAVARTADGACVSVHNDGPPISPEDQRRLFEPYERLKASAPSTIGWGLGLALVRACVDAHGGTIEVESNAADGTTFTILLPRDSRAAGAAADRRGLGGLAPAPPARS
jgi:signal transduction histidine kinase